MTSTNIARSDPLPGFFNQPSRAVRTAYWSVRDLSDEGWVVHVVGEPVARGGFIAETPGGRLVVHHRATGGDVCQLADRVVNHLGQLSHDERDYLRRLLAEHGLIDRLPQRRQRLTGPVPAAEEVSDV